MRFANQISKYSSLFLLLSLSSDEKKDKILKQLDNLGRNDPEFDAIKTEVTEGDPLFWGHLFAVVKKNPSISLSSLVSEKEKIIAEKNKKEQGKALKYTVEEQEAVKDISNNTVKDWALKALKDSEVLRKEPNKVQEIVRALNVIIHFKEENNVDLHSKYPGKNGFESAFKDAREWEESFKKSNSERYVTNVVVWSSGPWHIVEITGSEEEVSNDLGLEGKLMNHCVGGYTDHVMQGSSKIFSLRDGANKPHATIETDAQVFHFKQVYGPSNRELDSDKYSVIKTWQNTLHPKEKIIEFAKSDNINHKINATLFMNFADPEYSVMFDNLLSQYGNSPTNYFSNEADSVLAALAENETLSEDKYNLIYAECIKRKEMGPIGRLARNGKITLELFRIIANNTDFEYLDHVQESIASSRKLKDAPEVATELLNGNVTTIKIMVLNNPSVSSRVCIDSLIKNFNTVYAIDSEQVEHLEPKFIDDVISALRISKRDIDLKIINLLKQNINKIARENLFKLLNVWNVQYNKSDSIENLLKAFLNIKYKTENDWDFNLLAKVSEFNIYEPDASDELAESPLTSEAVLIALYDIGSTKTIRKILSNPNCPKQLLIKAINQNYTHSSVLSNPNIPADEIEKLLNDPNANHSELLDNPNITSAQISKMVQPHLSAIQNAKNARELSYIIPSIFGIARHPNTPVEILKLLATRNGLTYSVAQNPNVPNDVAANVLAKDSEMWNSNTSYDLQDSKAILKNSKLPMDFLKNHIDNLNPVYKNELLPSLAKNKNITPELASELAEDPSNFVKIEIIKNPSTPNFVLEKMFNNSINDKHGSIAATDIFKNPNISSDLIEKIYQHLKKVDGKDLYYYSGHAIKQLINNLNTPAHIINEIKDSDGISSDYKILALNNLGSRERAKKEAGSIYRLFKQAYNLIQGLN